MFTFLKAVNAGKQGDAAAMKDATTCLDLSASGISSDSDDARGLARSRDSRSAEAATRIVRRAATDDVLTLPVALGDATA
jgi:hypothetical protein